jgi:hypothetical protein
VLGLIVHLLSILGFNIQDKIPFVFLLHVGVFVVWIPAILDLQKNEELVAYQQSRKKKGMNPFGVFRIVFRQTPTWLMVIAIGCFFYAIVNFMLFMTSHQGTPDFRDGQYVLHHRGELIKTITEQEYHRYKANELRGISGHWLAFYGFAVAMLKQ